MVQSETSSQHRESGGVQVIARAAHILRALVNRPEGLSLSQISKEVGLARSTVHRIVSALEAERFVVPVSGNGRMRLGPGLAPLVASVRIELRHEVHPYLEQLSREVSETVDLAVLNQDQVLFVDQVAAPQRLQAVSAIGATFPLYCTANGKAILAKLSQAEVERLLPPQLLPFTPTTITSHERLMEEIARVRAEGVAYDREEHTLGICAIGVAIHDALGSLAAVTIPLPATRFYGNEERLAAVLIHTCDQIKQRLGTL